MKTFLTLLILVGSLAPVVADDLPKSRPFRLGMTRWPSDLTLEAFQASEKFAHEHSDIISVMFIGGIPWVEALDDKPYSKDVQNNLKYRPPKGSKLFLSISPLNKDRKELGPYWGEKDNMPLPKPWNTYALNDPSVKKAYLNFVMRAIQEMNPDYLAIGIENNVLLSNDAKKWAQLKELHSETYEKVKAKYPKLPVFFTTEVLHYKELANEAKGTPQEKEVAEMMKYSDYFAMSVYPHMSFSVKRPVEASFLDFAKKFKKPIVVSETGDTSQDVELKSFKLTLKGSEENQKEYFDMLLKKASADSYEFVVIFAGTDFPKLCEKLPKPVDDLARIWAYTGLQTDKKVAKPVQKLWDEYLKLPLKTK